MGVELVTPENVAFFNELSYIALGVILIAGVVFISRHFSKKNAASQLRWKTLVGEGVVHLVMAAFSIGVIGVMNVNFDEEAGEAVASTQERMEEHYGIKFAFGVTSFSYDSRADNHSLFDVDFVPENEIVYRGQVEIMNGRATLVVPEDLDAVSYVEYGTNLAVSPKNSINPTEVNTAKKYDDLIALVVFALIILGFIVGWKLNRLYENESFLVADARAPVRILRRLGFSMLSIFALSVFFVLFPYWVTDDFNKKNVAADDFAILEESYEVTELTLQDSFFSSYHKLHSDNGLYAVTFRDETGKITEGFLRSSEGEVSLSVRKDSSDMESIEYSQSLLGSISE